MEDIINVMKNGPPIGSDWYWSYNLPLQLFRRTDGTVEILNYMPRRAAVRTLDERLPAQDAAAFCEQAAQYFDNLATLFRAFGRGDIDHVYYHDAKLEEAIRDTKETRQERTNPGREPEGD